MLNVFTLSESINESINTANTAPVVTEEVMPSHEFVGSIDEATFSMNFATMMESLEATHYVVGSDEILVEAVVGRSPYMDTLIEASNTSFIDKIKAAFERFFKFLGGLITKLVDWAKTLASKTKSYNKQIKAATSKSTADPAQVKLDRYDYDVSKSMEVIQTAVKYVIEQNTEIMKKCQDDATTTIDSFIDQVNKNSNDIYAGASDVYEQLDARIKETQDKAESLKTEIIEQLAKKLFVNSGNDATVKSVLAAYKDDTRGEKKSVSVADLGGVDKILYRMDVTTTNMDTYIGILKGYQKNLNGIRKDLDKFYKVNKKIEYAEKAGDKALAVADKYEAVHGDDLKVKDAVKLGASVYKESVKYGAKCSNLYRAVYMQYVGIISQLTAIINGSQTLIRELANEEVSADVSILNAFVRAGKVDKKAKKEDKGTEDVVVEEDDSEEESEK